MAQKWLSPAVLRRSIRILNYEIDVGNPTDQTVVFEFGSYHAGVHQRQCVFVEWLGLASKSKPVIHGDLGAQALDEYHYARPPKPLHCDYVTYSTLKKYPDWCHESIPGIVYIDDFEAANRCTLPFDCDPNRKWLVVTGLGNLYKEQPSRYLTAMSWAAYKYRYRKYNGGPTIPVWLEPIPMKVFVFRKNKQGWMKANQFWPVLPPKNETFLGCLLFSAKILVPVMLLSLFLAYFACRLFGNEFSTL